MDHTGIDVFVHGHTHRVEKPFWPLAAEKLGWDPVVVNTGAWHRVISPEELADDTAPAAEVLRRTPESLPPCYTVLLVRPYRGSVPKPEMRSWLRKPDGAWGFGAPCGS